VTAWDALLAFWLALPPAAPYAPPPPAWLTTDARRLVTRPAWHLGIAGHTDGTGAAVTVQVSWL
jgi:hypothetical protein